MSQTDLMRQWLDHAPPPPQRDGHEYDVFISYRSADRRWAMALHDVLQQAEWQPFLDQYELVAGANLERALEEALEASASGVVLWSSRTVDSEWCRNERQAMRALDMPYVFAKLDQEDLPLFARSDLFVDFSDTPDGPRGANLLRLLWGLRQEPLPDQAVEFAQKLDEAVKSAVVSIKAAIEAENAEKITALARSSEPGVLSVPAPLAAAGEALIAMKEEQQALEVLELAQRQFPSSLRVAQLRGLALRRLERFEEAIEVLTELKAAGHHDPETLGILAAAWFGRYGESGKTLYLRRSRDMYRMAFQGDPSDYYTGINAATKSLFLGEEDQAHELANAVFEVVQTFGDGADLWGALTLAEVHLLRRQLAEAKGVYQRVIDRHSQKPGHLESARTQAEKICEALGIDETQARDALSPFDLLSEA